MNEAVFIRQNLSKWKTYEAELAVAQQQSPDRLADIYTDLMADLAFAQTQYPQARVTTVLNDMAVRLHAEIYRGRREKWSRLLTFWTREVPLAVADARREMLTSLTVFVVFILIGWLSAWGDSDFVRLIFGDDYVYMTIRNIQLGVPTDIYNQESGNTMFLKIAWNNLYVGLMAFAYGIFTSLGTGYYLMVNGVMFGAFMQLFADYGVLGPAALAIMQHGTLELSTIVVEGAAGIALGNGLLFPGTYSRWQSLRRSARRGLKIAVSAIPIVLLAAFIEAFVTRHVELPDTVRWAVIVASAAFILFYYVYLPYRLTRHDESAE